MSAVRHLCGFYRSSSSPSTRERPPGCKTVFVGGLPENATEEIIKEVFDQCGEIVAIRRARKTSATFVLVRSSWWTSPSTSLVCLCFCFISFYLFCLFCSVRFLGNLFCLISLPFVRGLFCFVRDWFILYTSLVFLSVAFRFIRELFFCFSTFRMCFYLYK